jgi:IS30 family transposase
MADRTAASMEIAIGRLLKLLGSELVQGITTDRGKEFACYKLIEEDAQE